MGIQQDIDKIKQMEDDYFAIYREYFETDNSKIVTIPDIGEDKELKEFTTHHLALWERWQMELKTSANQLLTLYIQELTQ